MLGRSAWFSSTAPALRGAAVSMMMAALVSASAHAQSAGISLSGSDKGVTATTTSTPPAAPPAPAASATVSAQTPAAAPAAAPAPAAPAAQPAPAAGQVDPAAATAVPAAAPGATEMDAGTYSVRLRDLEHSVNELKEQIFRSKARLSLLAETVLQGVVAGAQARIVHENKMGNSYKLVKVVYALDGAPILNKADEEGELGEREEFDVYNGSIVPGDHTLTVELEYRGHGYGIFSYLKGYRFKVTSSHTFTAGEGKVTTLHIVGYEKGGPTAPLEERPAVRYVERVDTPTATPAAAVPEAAEGGQ
jgi:nucleoid-associated protein YgaU